MRCVIAFIGLLWAVSAAAAPPPPPPQYIVDLAKTLVAPVTLDRLTAMSGSFAPDLKVSVNGKTTINGKAAWLVAERKLVGKIDRRVIAYSPGYADLMIFDQFDDRSGLPNNANMLFDPRYVTRAIRYQFGPDHLVHEIRILQGGVYVSPPDR